MVVCRPRLSTHASTSHGLFQFWKSFARLGWRPGDRALFTEVRNKLTKEIKVARRSFSKKLKQLLNK